MILDHENEFSDAQAITATAISDNVMDLVEGSSPSTVDIGNGEPVYLVVQVTADFDNLTSLSITLESDSTADLATSATTHISSGAVVLASLVEGAEVLRVRLPADDYERYLGVRYTVTGTNPSTGAVNAFLTHDVQRWTSHANAI